MPVQNAVQTAGCDNEPPRPFYIPTPIPIPLSALTAQASPDTILSKILGHVDTSLVHRVYIHFCDFDLVDAAAKIDLRLATKATQKTLPRVVSRRNGSKHENAISQ